MSAATEVRPATTTPTGRPVVGVALVLASAGLFALNGTVSKLLLRGGFDAPRLTALRAAGALFGLLVLCLVVPGPGGAPRRGRLRLRRAELPSLIGFGLTGFFLVPMLYFVAISRLPVGIGLLFEYMAPLAVALWVRFGQRRPVRRRLWVGLVLCVAGLAGVARIWTGSPTLDALGVTAGLTCALLLAVYYVLGSRSVAGRDPLSVTMWAFAFAAVAGAVVRPWWSFPTGLLTVHSGGVPMWLLALYLVLFGSIAAYLLVSTALRHLPPTSVGIIGMSEPVLASVFAWLLLSETLSTPQILGGLVVLSGVVLAETARSAPGVTPTPELPPT